MGFCNVRIIKWRQDGALPGRTGVSGEQAKLAESSEADVVVLGSGVAGLTMALVAALEGLSCIVLEHQGVFGGTSARSSGTVWVPDNSYMRAAGLTDDRVEAARYLEALVSGRGPRDMWETFLDRAPEMQADLAARAGIGFRPFVAAPDYRQDLPGAAAGWRALEPLPFDGRKLGAMFEKLARPLPELMVFGGMMVTRAEAGRLLRADRSIGGASLGLRLVAQFLADRLSYSRGARLVLGNALVARLLKAALDRGVEVRANVETTRLVMESGRASGVETVTAGAPHRILARRGVVLAGGGFPASPEWRARELPQPVAEYTAAAPGCVGRTLELAMNVGATLGPSGMDNALWFPSSIAKRADGSTAVYPHIVLDRSKPGSLVVDGAGKRFVNEAVSYHEFVRGMYRANQADPAVPAWMICDREFIRRYGFGLIRPRTPSLRKYVRDGYLSEAATIPALAEKIGVPAEGLAATVARFNGFAASGEDLDFHRGETIYDRGNGDPAHAPNPCLGPVAHGPFYAVALLPTPLGTSRGLVADRHARVLDRDGQAIPGLYVCGNDMQSAFGGEYPGAGGQLGQGMTFGWIAARHAAGRDV